MKEIKIQDLNMDFNINQKHKAKDCNRKNFDPIKKKQVKKLSIDEIGSESCCKEPSIIKKSIKRISKTKTEKDYSLIDEI